MSAPAVAVSPRAPAAAETPPAQPAPAPAAEDYWTQSRSPLSALVVVLPIIVCYEIGIREYAAAADLVRNGADHYMRSQLEAAGIMQPLVLPAMVVFGLLAWHSWKRLPWQVSIETTVGIVAESILAALGLVFLGQLQDLFCQQWNAPVTVAATPSAEEVPWAGRVVSFLGAGVYEEFLFRMCLVPAVYLMLRALLLPKKPALWGSVVATSLMFAGAHYLGPAADPFQWNTFVFRTMAGGVFATLFVYRGFGVTVGCHTFYDLLVGVLLPLSRGPA